MKNSSLVCIDANLLILALLPFPLSERADALLEECRRNRRALVAPALFAFEVSSTLHRLRLLGQITPTAEETAFKHFMAIEVHLSSHPRIFPLARQLAQRFHQSRPYEMAYVALAELHGCDLWTADRRLVQTVGLELPFVRWLGDFDPAAGPEFGR
ncbi:MAG: type II toxin-antitoxin system VapC family toxin [Caldilineaceae bacterium]|nr:type II toxin-antitoxin system VapC family toxin [Caldilineaceae bacterium]HRJ42156.1 type II toxin-antitoxin system VapC family toxin [Caldilineaceae bacterium]